MKRKILSSMLAAAVVVTSTFSTTSVSEAKETDVSSHALMEKKELFHFVTHLRQLIKQSDLHLTVQ